MPLYRGSRRLVLRRNDAPQTTAFLARTSGLSGTETAAYKALINGLLADGVFSLLDALYILATNTTTTAKLNLCGTNYGMVYHGVPSEATQFSADHGYTGNAANVYLDTQFDPFTATTPNYALNGASFGAYVLTNRTTAQSKVAIGAQQGALFSYFAPYESANAIDAEVNAGNFPAGISTTTAQGFTGISRTGSSGFSIYKNASSTPLGSPTSAVGAAVPNDFFALFNFGAGGTSWSDDQIAAAFIGGGLTGAQWASLASRVNAYMTALGINVY